MSCGNARSSKPAAASALVRAATVTLALAAGCATTTSQAPASSTIHEMGPSGAPSESAAPGKSEVVRVLTGKASWYGREQQGGPTASGERFDMHALTAAHKTLRLGTRVRVVNLANGRSVVVRINDRGPYGRGRIIDVSYAAARELGMIDKGVVPVRVEVLR
jgi:rare lipoprotein A